MELEATQLTKQLSADVNVSAGRRPTLYTTYRCTVQCAFELHIRSHNWQNLKPHKVQTLRQEVNEHMTVK